MQPFSVKNQSGKGMKKELQLLGEEAEGNYSPIKEVVSIAVL
jgi:hypothetical protein